MFLVGGLDARLLGEIQPADDADALGHVAVHAGHLGVAGGLHQRAVEFLVPLGHLHGVGAALGHRCQPDVGQLVQQRVVDAAVALAQAVRGGGFQHHAQVVQLLELVEIEGQHAPAAAEQHLDEAFLLQPHQRLAHRRARHAEPVAQLVLGEAVTGHELEFGHIALELRVDLVRARAEGGRAGGRSPVGGAQSGGHGGMVALLRPRAVRPGPHAGRRRSRSSRRWRPGHGSCPPWPP